MDFLSVFLCLFIVFFIYYCEDIRKQIKNVLSKNNETLEKYYSVDFVEKESIEDLKNQIFKMSKEISFLSDAVYNQYYRGGLSEEEFKEKLKKEREKRNCLLV
jgi:hypothetical protein